jgi:hypothetical protein
MLAVTHTWHENMNETPLISARKLNNLGKTRAMQENKIGTSVATKSENRPIADSQLKPPFVTDEHGEK